MLAPSKRSEKIQAILCSFHETWSVHQEAHHRGARGVNGETVFFALLKSGARKRCASHGDINPGIPDGLKINGTLSFIR